MLDIAFVPDAITTTFYRTILRALAEHNFRFAVGGTYALQHHTGMVRETKDLDLFVRREDITAILSTLERAGYASELRYPHWLAKVFDGEKFVDLIFSSGNGIATVDDVFFIHASEGTLFGCPVLFCPVEEIIWSKAFVMERERYDGADVAHLLHVCSDRIDWKRLVMRFAEHWRVLLSHLVLFGFIYPSHTQQIPAWVIEELTERLRQDTVAARQSQPVCGGTLLSRAQFLTDVHEWGYMDGRLRVGAMSEHEIDAWTRAIRGSEG